MSDELDTEQTEEGIAKLRKEAKDGRAAKDEASRLQRELAFVKAGVDTDSKPAKALLNSYDGPLEPDAIRAEAKEWGLMQEVSTQTEETPTPQTRYQGSEEAEQQRLRDEAGGAPAPTEKPVKGGVDAAFEQFLTDRDAGLSQEAATNRAFGAVIKAAAQGDAQARFDPNAWNERAAEEGHGAEYARS